jgi:autotransporter-associated beta strand protein
MATGLTGGGQGVATFTGGSATIDGAYRVILGDKPSSTGVLNIGTLAGGSAVFTASNTANAVQVLADNAAISAILNLNRGTLRLGGPIYKNTANTTGTGAVNLNGGILQAGANNATLANNTLDNVNVYNGGVVVDSQTNTATISASLHATTGNGIYRSASIPVPAGGSAYIGAPIVTVSTASGSGSGATAIATLSGGVVSSVTFTSPGQGYAAGDAVNFDFSGGGATTPAGSFAFTLQAADLAANAIGGLTKIGVGKLTLSGTNTYAGTTVVSNGTLSVTGSLLGNGTVTVKAGATLGGTGTILGAVSVDATGTVAVDGSSIGVLWLSNNLAFASGATNSVRLNKTSMTNDSVRGLSLVSYAGTLVVTNQAGSLAPNDSFKLFDATTYSGSFTTIVPTTPGAGLAWDQTHLAVDGTLRVVSTVNTTPTNLVVVVSDGNLNLSWPADYLGWRLECQTNSISTGLSANWATWPNSTNVNSVQLPIDPKNPTVFFRLTYP